MDVQRELEDLIRRDLPNFYVLPEHGPDEPEDYETTVYWLVIPPAADLVGFPRIYGQVIVSYHEGCYYQISHWSTWVRFWDPKRSPVQEGLEELLADQPDSVSVVALPVPFPLAGPFRRLKLRNALRAEQQRRGAFDHLLFSSLAP